MKPRRPPPPQGLEAARGVEDGWFLLPPSRTSITLGPQPKLPPRTHPAPLHTLRRPPPAAASVASAALAEAAVSADRCGRQSGTDGVLLAAAGGRGIVAAEHAAVAEKLAAEASGPGSASSLQAVPGRSDPRSPLLSCLKAAPGSPDLRSSAASSVMPSADLLQQDLRDIWPVAPFARAFHRPDGARASPASSQCASPSPLSLSRLTHQWKR